MSANWRSVKPLIQNLQACFFLGGRGELNYCDPLKYSLLETGSRTHTMGRTPCFHKMDTCTRELPSHVFLHWSTCRAIDILLECVYEEVWVLKPLGPDINQCRAAHCVPNKRRLNSKGARKCRAIRGKPTWNHETCLKWDCLFTSPASQMVTQSDFWSRDPMYDPHWWQIRLRRHPRCTVLMAWHEGKVYSIIVCLFVLLCNSCIVHCVFSFWQECVFE